MNPLWLFCGKIFTILTRYSGVDRKAVFVLQTKKQTVEVELTLKELLEIENGIKLTRQKLLDIHLEH